METASGGSHTLSSPLLLQPERPTSPSCLTTKVEYRGNGKYWKNSVDRCSMKSEHTVDPFRNSTPHIDGVYEVLKMVVCVPIAVLRLVLFGVCLAVGYVATLLAILNWNDTINPMPRWRSRLMAITRFCGRVILFAFGYHWIRRRGKPAPREVAPIVVSNHVSYIEPIFFFYELFPTIVASDSHDSIPIVGAIIRAMQVIYVNRFSSSSRKQAVNEITRMASSNGFRRLLLFPEGTTTNGKVLLSFKLGAFIPGCAIQPVVVRYPFVHFDQSWGNASLSRLMIRMFLQFHNFMEVEYLPVIYPCDKCKENPAYFAAKVGYEIATSLNVLQTFYSFGDIMLLQKATEAKHVNPSSFLVEMARVESLYNVSISEVLFLLDKFLSMNPSSSGRVKLEEFSTALGLPACSLSEEVFNFVDVDEAGTVTFKQFVYASGHMTRQPLFWQLCDAAFNHCGGKRGFNEQEFADAIREIEDLEDSAIRNLFRQFDSDGTGTVSRDAFVSCIRRNPFVIVFLISLSEWHALVGSSTRHPVACRL